MADIIINLAGLTRRYVIDASEVTQVLNAFRTGNPNMTNDQVADLIADGWVQSLIDQVQQTEINTKVAAARASVAPITIPRA